MNRKDLVDKLILMKSCLSTQDFIPVLKHFCFTGKKVVAFNGTQAACLNLEIGLDCGLPGDLLVKLLNSYSSEKLILEQKDNEVFMKSGSSKTKLALLPSTDFIFKEPLNVKGYEVELGMDFIDGLEKCLISVSDNPQMQNQTGVTFISSKKPFLYSTDGICISQYKLDNSGGDEFIVMLPKLFCEQLIIWFREFGKGTILFGKKFVQADFISGFLHTQLDMEMEFLDFAGEFSKIFKSELEFTKTPEELSTILDRSLLFSSSSKELDQFVDIEIDEGFMEVKTTTANGNIKDEVDLGKAKTEDLKFRIDSKLLKRAVDSTTEMTFSSIENCELFVGRGTKFLHVVNSFAK